MDLVRQFRKAFQRKKERGWKHIYVFVDIHDTIFPSDYGEGKSFKYHVNAHKVLQMLSNRRDVVLGIYTASHPEAIAGYLDKFQEDKILFQLINENPLEKNTKYACFDKKPYFNVLIDDKAGFDASGDWYPILKYLEENPV